MSGKLKTITSSQIYDLGSDSDEIDFGMCFCDALLTFQI